MFTLIGCVENAFGKQMYLTLMFVAKFLRNKVYLFYYHLAMWLGVCVCARVLCIWCVCECECCVSMCLCGLSLCVSLCGVEWGLKE